MCKAKQTWGVFEVGGAYRLQLADVCGSRLFRTEATAREWAAQLAGWHPDRKYVVSSEFSTFGAKVGRDLTVRLTVQCPCGSAGDNPACPYHGETATARRVA